MEKEVGEGGVGAIVVCWMSLVLCLSDEAVRFVRDGVFEIVVVGGETWVLMCTRYVCGWGYVVLGSFVVQR